MLTFLRIKHQWISFHLLADNAANEMTERTSAERTIFVSMHVQCLLLQFMMAEYSIISGADEMYHACSKQEINYIKYESAVHTQRPTLGWWGGQSDKIHSIIYGHLNKSFTTEEVLMATSRSLWVTILLSWSLILHYTNFINLEQIYAVCTNNCFDKSPHCTSGNESYIVRVCWRSVAVKSLYLFSDSQYLY